MARKGLVASLPKKLICIHIIPAAPNQQVHLSPRQLLWHTETETYQAGLIKKIG
jgi:hypothetical protein